MFGETAAGSSLGLVCAAANFPLSLKKFIMAALRSSTVPNDLLPPLLYLVPPACQSLILVAKRLCGILICIAVARSAKLAAIASRESGKESSALFAAIWSNKTLNAIESCPPFVHRNGAVDCPAVSCSSDRKNSHPASGVSKSASSQVAVRRS